MSNIAVVFVILHYKTLDDTLECIRSLKKLNDFKKCKIVVVDNGSSNNEHTKILEKQSIDLITLEKNLGFAKGNNVGCKYAIKYNPDYLCVINNDIIIDDKDFISKIYSIYNEVKFDVLGPKILTNNSDSVNPFPVYKTLEEINSRIAYTKKLLKIYNNKFLRFLLSCYSKFKRLIFGKKQLINGTNRISNVALHGCALIFSKKYYEKYTDIFYNETFLYHEEEFLYYRAIKDNLLMVYDPDIELFHKEGRSLDKAHNSDKYKKLIFRNTEILNSLELLKKVYEEDRRI